MIEVEVYTTTIKRYRFQFGYDYLVGVLNGDIKLEKKIPHNAKIFVSVPGGADWSSVDLDIDQSTPLIVTWEEETTEYGK